MENNVGSNDQIVRIILGSLIGLISIGILTSFLDFNEIYSLLLGIISIGLLVTGFRGKCGLYQSLGVNTCKLE